MHLLFSPIVGMMIQSDFHIFKGVGIPPTSYIYIVIIYIPLLFFIHYNSYIIYTIVVI